MKEWIEYRQFDSIPVLGRSLFEIIIPWVWPRSMRRPLGTTLPSALLADITEESRTNPAHNIVGILVMEFPVAWIADTQATPCQFLFLHLAPDSPNYRQRQSFDPEKLRGTAQFQLYQQRRNRVVGPRPEARTTTQFPVCYIEINRVSIHVGDRL